MTIAQRSLRVARVTHLALLFAAVAYLAVPMAVAPVNPRRPDPVLIFALGVVAFSTLGAATFFRARLIQPASEKLQGNQEDKTAAAQWQRGVVLSLVFCETVIIFGCLFRLMGAPRKISGIFYAVGVFVLLAWRPKLELPPT